MPDTAFLLALAGAALGAASLILHVVAPRTKTTIDDAIRDDLDQVLAWWRGRQAGVVPGATKPAEPPRNPQAGFIEAPLWAVLAALAGALLVVGALVASCTAAQVRQGTAAGVIGALDCEAAHLDAQVLADARALADAEIQRLITGTAPDDLAGLRAKLTSDLAPIKSDLGRCAVAGAIAAMGAGAVPTPGEAVSALSAGPPPVRAAFSLAARELGWPVVRVAGGTTL